MFHVVYILPRYAVGDPAKLQTTITAKANARITNSKEKGPGGEAMVQALVRYVSPKGPSVDKL
jgi:hypothetical protein